MSDHINDGGPAFPQITELGDIAATSEGMTLRDWFSGQAINAYMNWALHQPINDEVYDSNTAAEKYARVAYQIADAMLAARKGGAR